MRRKVRSLVVTLGALALLCATPALADFGDFGSANPPDPADSPRVDTPNDPDFDRCEPDDEDGNPGDPCGSYFEEQYGAFGFGPASSTAKYQDKSQLDQQGRDANKAAHGNAHEFDQISGIRADTAWKYSTGRPDVVIAILDNGFKWGDEELVDKVALNDAELPTPQVPVGCASLHAGEDPNGDGKLSVADFACDPRVSKDGGDDEYDGKLDASDLIAAFSDHTDADHNGYVDDIAGWDFFDDDNDPLDSSACCDNGHGSDRAKSAGGATNNAKGEAGICPECQLLPMRTSDDIIHDTNLDGMATIYAADNGASVTECACGDLLNSDYARRAFRYADGKGVAQLMVSSDINSANHNYPTDYNESIYVAGSLPDTAPGKTCGTPGLPAIGGGQDIPGCSQFLDLLDKLSNHQVQPQSQPPTTSFFRNANLTQYGGKADIVLMGSTGSENTGQAAGAAGLLEAYARQKLHSQLSGNETRQLLTMTAEDVLPGNTGSIGLPDKANKGWDSHFGYGRVDLAAAMKRISDDRIPPEVQIDAPDWFAPIPVEKVGADGLAIRGHVGSPHIDGAVEWRLEYACGQDATDDSFHQLAGWTEGEPNGELARLSKSTLSSLADCDGSVHNDAGRPAGNPKHGAPWPANPYPEPDPERHAFQIRLTAREKDDPGNVGTYRKTLFAYHDRALLDGWPKALGPAADATRRITDSGGESSPRLADLNGDNRLDLILATTAGELYVLGPDGSPLSSFNSGEPVRTLPYSIASAHGPGGAGSDPPREPLRVPAVGDITGDGEPEIVVTAGERVYAWHRDGSEVAGFPKRLTLANSAPCKPGKAQPCFHPADRLRTPDRHVKRGFVGSPALADLDGDGRLDVVAGALDQYLYAWTGSGDRVSGFPVRLDSEGADTGAESINSPAIADLDGDGKPEVIEATNEIVGGAGFDPNDPFTFFIGQATGDSVTYAVHGNGKFVDGWPVHTGVLAGDLLPYVLPGTDAAVADVDHGKKGDEVSVAGGSGGAKLVAGDGKTIRTYTNVPVPGVSGVFDPSIDVNVADYPSFGRLSDAGGLSVIKGGLSLGFAANLFAANQNLPGNHVVQAWDPSKTVAGSAPYRAGWPVATDDFQILTQPAIARVGGSGGGRQALEGTGLYQLHAYGANGEEPSGWPKFTGGWQIGVPTIGDLDGDGKLDVVTNTREGWAFAWSTGVPSCEADGTTTNSEWWTFHHDEHSWANYGHDARPPSRPAGLHADRLPGGDLRLEFTGSGDDLDCGRAARYEVAGSSAPIGSGQDFVHAHQLGSSPASSPRRGGGVALTVPRGASFDHVAVRAVDDAGNRSYVAGESSVRGVVSTPPSTSAPKTTKTFPAPGAGAGGTRGASGSLPFTGLALGALALLGLVLAVVGRHLRRRLAS